MQNSNDKQTIAYVEDASSQSRYFIELCFYLSELIVAISEQNKLLSKQDAKLCLDKLYEKDSKYTANARLNYVIKVIRNKFRFASFNSYCYKKRFDKFVIRRNPLN